MKTNAEFNRFRTKLFTPTLVCLAVVGALLPSAVKADDPPTISAIDDRAINANGSLTLDFTIGDTETPPGLLIVTATSSNLALVPNENLILGGSESERKLTITPAPEVFGTTEITVTCFIWRGTMA